MSSEVGGLHIRSRPLNTSQTFLAIEVARFLPLAEFQSRMERLVKEVKSARPAKGYSEVLVAGDPEWRTESVRKRNGIPLDPSLWNRLQSLVR